tara:strand:+ start:301 stop:495 length:195 start_codon:yes stop_codon:yes gene_type:complete
MVANFDVVLIVYQVHEDDLLTGDADPGNGNPDFEKWSGSSNMSVSTGDYDLEDEYDVKGSSEAE